MLLVAGAAIAPTYAAVYAMVDDAAPAGTVTEAFAWLATAIAIGASLGAAGAGALADHAGPAAAFALAGAAGAVALLAALLRSPTLPAIGSRAVAVAPPEPDSHGRTDMGRIVVTEFISLDGVIEDPGGAEGFRHGGWTFAFKRLFGDTSDRKPLKLTESRMVGEDGVAIMVYEPAPAG